MDQISLIKSKFKYDHWKKVIEDCQASGKTVVAYCKENNVNEKSYYYWLRKVREQLCKNMDYSETTGENNNEFAQIQLPVSYQHTIPTIKLQIGKIVVEISDGISHDTISYVLNGIRNIC